MNRREFLKKSLEGIIIGSIPLISSCGKNPVESESELNNNSIVKDNIEYYMQTNKKEYKLGENVEMLYRVRNLGNKEVIFNFSGQVQYYFAATKDGNLTYYWYSPKTKDGNLRWFAPKVGLPALSSFGLEPGGYKEYTETWNMIDERGTTDTTDDTLIAVGSYYIMGSLHPMLLSQKNKYVPVSVSININPK